ncbi:MAG: MFS transporter [Leptolinea sp.]|jgi:MFS family permease|nr:MFS transporter [Leptolinea sp.]
MTIKGVIAGLRTNIKLTFIALRHPNYRLWFEGQLVSLVGTWMQNTAQGFLVFELTNSPAFLGYVAFASGLPSWLFTLYGGVIADRIPRRNMIIITQVSMMVLAFIQAALVFTGLIQPWHILILAFLLGIATAFDAPARQSFVVELVDREDMTNAIALNSTMFNMATVVGPAIAGLTYAAVGPAWCFTINGVSFIAVIIALLLMKLPPRSDISRTDNTFAQLKEGLLFTRSNTTIIGILFMIGTVSVFANGMLTLIPAWSVNILHGDATTNGLMLSARGFGSMLGGIFIAWLSRFHIRGKALSTGSLLLPIIMIAFSFTTVQSLSMLLICITGFFFMLVINNANAMMQTMLPDQLRGRVMSIYILVFFGAQPLGSLLAGQMAESYGEALTVLLFAASLFICSLIIHFRLPALRKVD